MDGVGLEGPGLLSATMHRCLCITEVLRVIAYSVNDNDALFNMSLTCRAFLEPALDALWYELSESEPLIELFPKSKRGEEPRGHLVSTSYTYRGILNDLTRP